MYFIINEAVVAVTIKTFQWATSKKCIRESQLSYQDDHPNSQFYKKTYFILIKNVNKGER